jgi:L-alanine-DL-glutamate epimerase-like enolase superfamily enzyme
MKLRFRYYELHLQHTFTISRSSSNIRPSVIVEIEHDGIIGYGESAPSERYGEDKSTVTEFLKRIDLSQFSDPFELEDILCYIGNLSDGNNSAKAGIDIALHDWIGKKLNLPVWKFLGFNKSKMPSTSYTIGIDSIAMIEQKVKEAESFPILKVKVGVHDDIEIIKSIRNLTDKIIRVDANEGWKSKEEALEKILRLEEQGIELIEQPMPADDLEGTAWLRERVHIPLIADESFRYSKNLRNLHGVFDGINIKLMKCSGMREAVRAIHAAGTLNMKIMIGCMIESSVGISAAAQLSALADYVDLDGNLLIANDPFSGINVLNGKLILSDLPGLGVHSK